MLQFSWARTHKKVYSIVHTNEQTVLFISTGYSLVLDCRWNWTPAQQILYQIYLNNFVVSQIATVFFFCFDCEIRAVYDSAWAKNRIHNSDRKQNFRQNDDNSMRLNDCLSRIIVDKIK